MRLGVQCIEMSKKRCPHSDEMAAPHRAGCYFFGVFFFLFVFFMFLHFFRNGKFAKGAVSIGRYFVDTCCKILLMDW